MPVVKRWFMETPDGDVVDGPFKKRPQLDAAFALYVKQYKYTPIVVEREIDVNARTERRNGYDCQI